MENDYHKSSPARDHNQCIKYSNIAFITSAEIQWYHCTLQLIISSCRVEMGLFRLILVYIVSSGKSNAEFFIIN